MLSREELISSFLCGSPVAPTPSIEKTVLSLFSYLGIFVESRLSLGGSRPQRPQPAHILPPALHHPWTGLISPGTAAAAGGEMFSSSPPPSGPLEKLFQYIDLHQDEFVQTLKEWVAIESNSVQPVLHFRQELSRMMAVATDKLQCLGAAVDSVDLGSQQDLPVNIKFILEGMEEAGSVALEELVTKEKHRFFSSVDYIVISDNLWISRTKPALTYGTRGNSYFMVEVKCRDQDFHSGTFGGILNEPMAELIALLDSLVDSTGHILIPGIYDQVAPLTEEEKKTYETIDLDLEEYQNSSQVEKFLYGTKEEILMHLWRYPSLSIHGIEGAFDKPGTKTVIPGRVVGKFSIRLVPHMNVSVVEKQVKQHLEAVFSKRNSSNQMSVSLALGLQPWITNINDNQYLAAKAAIKTVPSFSRVSVFGIEPDMIQDGSTIPIARIFQDIIQKSVMMLPLGAVDDGEHSQNEKINRWNYIEGSKLFAAFFLELAKLHE
ncbi:beta-Ala-His dipeptidase isoform X5 [Castor canadensis]|uniref:Beta-Ala-His dipeptidase isoform X5 n=1 Tax=Castor canadensis TaxID=51338 RepID=A0AC58M8K5_CASCN